MTMDYLNTLLDAACKGTLIGICASFWIFGLVAIWKWFLGVAKKFLHWVFPNCKWFKPKTDKKESE